MAGRLALFTQRIGCYSARPSPLLVLAHAGSFCKEVWRPFISHLDDIGRENGTDACIVAFDFSGHGDSAKRWKPGTNFNDFVGKDVLDALEYCRRHNSDTVFNASQQWTDFDPSDHGSGDSSSTPVWDEVYGIGHSVGGSAIIQAEYTRPNQFKDIVAFEPVIYPSVEPREPIKDNTLSKGAERRRASFPSREEALEYLRDKPIFKTWDLRCLEEFVWNGGLRDIEEEEAAASSESDTVTLKCDKYFEAQMYRTYPEMWDYIHKIHCPTHILLGEQSQMFEGTGTGISTAEIVQAVAKRLPNSTFDVLPGCGHFMVMERPRLCAEIVAKKTGLSLL